MTEKEFDLLREPWVPVMDGACEVKEVSLTDALVHAHEYRELAGELSTQNVALLRLLLAVMHAVFERVDADGNDSPITDAGIAVERWQTLWENGRLPEKPIKDYLEAHGESFWLFHPERPFYQVPGAEIGTEYKASKMNGSMSESSNKVRLFPERTGEDKNQLTYAEAARWLLYVNGFDDTSSKASKSGKESNGGSLPSVGAGWLGKIGNVFVCGDNLFETLMLNFVTVQENEEPWLSAVPVWEHETVKSAERTEIAMPCDQAALLTLQSRRLLLKRENGYVTGFWLLGGDFFARENAFSELMTVWAPIKDKKTGEIQGYTPKRHDKSKQMWREFASYVSTERVPGVVWWNTVLQENDVLDGRRNVRLQIAAVQYGDKDFFAADQIADGLTLHANLLTSLGRAYREHISVEIARCDSIAGYIAILAKELFLAAGGDTEKVKSWDNTVMSQAKEQYYFAIDVPFRRWLAKLDASDTAEQTEEYRRAWRAEAEQFARALAGRMLKEAGPAAFVGKTVDGKYLSSSVAENRFMYSMSRLKEG